MVRMGFFVWHFAAGTLNSDEARDFALPLKNRFYIQPLAPAEAAVRVKESAKDIVGVKSLIDKKAWPYVQNDLRSKASYLRFDLNTIISSKPKEEKVSLKELTGKLLKDIDDVSSVRLLLVHYSYMNLVNYVCFLYQLDHAAKIKSTPEAEKSYAQTVSSLNAVLSKLG